MKLASLFLCPAKQVRYALRSFPAFTLSCVLVGFCLPPPALRPVGMTDAYLARHAMDMEGESSVNVGSQELFGHWATEKKDEAREARRQYIASKASIDKQLEKDLRQLREELQVKSL